MRAQTFAGPDAVGAPSGSSTVPLLTFDLGNHQFALPSATVREIVRAVWISPLPKAPPIVEGVINVRGALVPVCDIRGRFGIAEEPIGLLQHLVIANAGDRIVALRVDRATDLVTVEWDVIEKASQVAPGAQYVAGIARLTDGLLVIVDLGGLLSLHEAGLIDNAIASAVESPLPPRRKSP